MALCLSAALAGEGPLAFALAWAGLLLLPRGIFYLIGGIPSRLADLGLLLAGWALLGAWPRARVRPRFVVWLLPFLWALMVIARLGWDGPIKAGRVLFDESHASWESSLRPSAGKLARERDTATGHGDLAWLLGAWGYRVSRLDVWSEERLAGADILVLPFPTRRYEPAEREAILRFVERGGGLLAIGEHTNMEGVMESLNPVLEPMGLSLRFDTVWLADAHRETLAHAAHPTTLAATHLNVANGASVRTSGWNVTPLLTARWGAFSDQGSQHNRSGYWLGDSKFQAAEEAAHDLVLAAAARAGNGRAVLLGDSTYLQNGGIFDAPGTARAIFHWLDHREGLPIPPGAARWLVLALALAVAAMALLAGADAAALLRAGALSIVLTQVLVTVMLAPGYSFRALFLPERVLIDQAHADSVAPYHRTRARPGTEIDALLGAIQASGRFPVAHFQGGLDRLQEDGWAGVVLPGPRAPLTSKEVQWLLRVVETGAPCLVIVDPEFVEGANPLLEELGVQVSRLPVAARASLSSGGVPYQVPGGPLSVELTPDPLFDGAGAFRMARPWELRPVGGDHPYEALARHAGGDALVRVRRGKGFFLILADPPLVRASALESDGGALEAARWRFFSNVFRKR